MSKIAWRLYEDLNRLKGYEGVYSTASPSAILIKNEGKLYKVLLEEINEKEVTNEVINKYL